MMRGGTGAEADFITESNGSITGTLFEARYGGHPSSRLISRTDHFAALADLAPICKGHILLVPRAYLPSLGALPESWWPELEGLLALVGDALAETFGAPWIVEHGSSSRLRRSPCISHAHLHVLPARVELAEVLRDRGADPHEIGSLRDLAELAERDRAYLCWGPAAGPLMVADVEDGVEIPRQFVRRHLAAAFGQEVWDWGVPATPELLRETVRDLRISVAEVESLRGPSS